MNRRNVAAGMFAGIAGALFSTNRASKSHASEQEQVPAMRSHEVSVTRRTVIPGAPDAVFDFIVAEDVLPKVLTGYGPLPAVVSTSARTGPWDTPGSSRVIHFSDGGRVREQVREFSRPERFSYRVWDFSDPFIGSLAIEGRGAWTFARAQGGTAIVWTYTFVARNVGAKVLLAPVVHVLWRGYMDRCLENTRRIMSAPRQDGRRG